MLCITNRVWTRLFCGLLVGALTTLAHGQVIIGGGPHPIRPRPIIGGGGPGGHYTGPGDTVPPGGGGSSSSCTGGVCGTPPATCGTNCCTVSWKTETVSGCYLCICDGLTHHVQSYSLTFDTLYTLCLNPPAGCVDANGNITVCKTFPEACDTSASISGWLVQGYYQNYPNMPPLGTVPTLACTDGTVMCSSTGCTALGLFCDTNRSSQCLNCRDGGSHTVTLTFNKSCMLNALQSWISLMNSQGVPYSTYKDYWMLNVAATLCDPCTP